MILPSNRNIIGVVGVISCTLRCAAQHLWRRPGSRRDLNVVKVSKDKNTFYCIIKYCYSGFSIWSKCLDWGCCLYRPDSAPVLENQEQVEWRWTRWKREGGWRWFHMCRAPELRHGRGCIWLHTSAMSGGMGRRSWCQLIVRRFRTYCTVSQKYRFRRRPLALFCKMRVCAVVIVKCCCCIKVPPLCTVDQSRGSLSCQSWRFTTIL